MASVMKIGTHNGIFHCDEILACFMLKQLPKYKDSIIIRTRDPAVLETCDIVVDVGGIYDLSKNRFDHHQKSFNETFSSINSSKRWEIKLSSAGLIYVHFSKQIIEAVLKKYSHLQILNEKMIEKLEDKIYEDFIREIDAIDNGIEIGENKKYDITTNLSSRVSFFNPNWNEKGVDEYERFEKAMSMVGYEFEERIRYYALVWWPARSIVEESIKSRFKVDKSGAIISLERNVPWKSHLFDLEKEFNLKNNELKYVIYKDEANDSWRIQCVPISENSFINRLTLPSEWLGLRDEALSKLTNIENCIFVHSGGFIGGNKTYEGALSMLQRALTFNKNVNY